MNYRGFLYLLGLALVLTLGASSTVAASVISCPSNIADNVDGGVACQYADSSPANSSPATETSFVNSQMYFGTNDWIFAGKDEGDETESGEPEIGFGATFDDPRTSGTWSIDQLAFTVWESIMLLFKDGNDTTPVGYLIDLTGDVACSGGVCTGDWLSPFEDPPFEVANPREVSHITAFVSESSTAVPEPATLLLLGAGLLGMVRVGRWLR